MTQLEDAPGAETPESDPTRDETLALEAIALAVQLLHHAQNEQTSDEKKQAEKIAGMMDDPDGKALTMVLSDQAFRSQNPIRMADQIKHLLDEYGVPHYFSRTDQRLLQLGGFMGRYMPHIVVPFIVDRVRKETENVILAGEEKPFKEYLQKRRNDGTRLNINRLGEAILGEEEAERRLDAYLELLARPDVEYISVKISSVFSQINLVAVDHTVEEIKQRLRRLYRQAMAYEYVQPNGIATPKFVNLDMEEYRDLRLTVAAFQDVLDEEEFRGYRAGIVLQAYLPESSVFQKLLTEWAIQRVVSGGAPIKIRIVKGANLAMEKVEADWHGWEQAPYRSKEEVDANYKRMVTYGMTKERAQAVNLGIASHNLFDVAYALILREKHGLKPYVEFEMLEGMANHQARAVQEEAGGLLLYAPVVNKEDFHSAIAYLVRRLDENTAPENFLHDLFGLEVDTPQWEEQKTRFLNAYRRMHDIGVEPQRQQNRQTERIQMRTTTPFENEPDTDFPLPQNQEWIRNIRDSWVNKEIAPIPLQIGGEFVSTRKLGEGHDPSRPGEVAYEYALATKTQIAQALRVAQEAQVEWGNLSVAKRKGILVRCAHRLAKNRGDLIGAMMLDGGKAVTEADVEVSEAVDFANYYARSLDIANTELKDCEFAPYGVVLITPPWNFPLAIPAGGILAALMAGNAVILKPAPEAVLVGWQIVNALWDAGVPKEVLQFLPTTDDEVGKELVTNKRVDAVILTGAYETGRMFRSWKPEMRLFAETSGKNSMIVTALADHDQAIKDLVKSAFGHNGQKCSAASLAVLEAEVYDNPAFMRQLRDAASSLSVGSAWELHSSMTPIIREPGTDLKRALTTLESGESWLLEPRMIDGNPNLWTPGIKLGVQQGSFFHKTECFGPVLGLIRARNLKHAVEIVNDSGFGLTSGLQSLDDREIAYWRERVEVGNAYINRGTTGAIVQRQPFGGWKKSVFGYTKAGGPNYVLSLGTWHDPAFSETSLDEIRANYQQAWDSHFSLEHDPSDVLGESNDFRYVPISHMTIRLENEEHLKEAQAVAIAAEICGVPLTISAPVALKSEQEFRVYQHVLWEREDDKEFIERLRRLRTERLRIFEPVSTNVYEVANAEHIQIVDAPVVGNGRLELRHYLREQAISHTTHRYGNIISPPEGKKS